MSERPASGDLPAGRELDAVVAAAVLGCKVRWWNRFDGTREPCCDCDMNEDGEIPHADDSEYKHGCQLWAYSTSIAAAWTVVEKLSPAHPFILSDSSSDPEALGPWEASFGERYAVSVTAPHAICLAALRAVEGET